MYKILTPVKRVVDYQAKIKISADSSSVVTEGVKWVLNPFDEIAVEEAIRIKEKRQDVEVVVVSIGPEEIIEQVRLALAMGADRAILVSTSQTVDSDLAARIIAAVCAREEFSMVIMGKQAVDSDANQTGQLLAGRLSIAQATFASKVVIDEPFKSAEVTREVDGGLQTITIDLPAVITTDLRLNEPRYPSLPGIVKAKKKPIETLSLEQLEITAQPKVKIVKLMTPAGRKKGVKVQSVNELYEKLKTEAKVI